MSGHGHPRAKRGRSYLVIFNPTISRNILFFSSQSKARGRLTPSYSECPLLLEFRENKFIYQMFEIMYKHTGAISRKSLGVFGSLKIITLHLLRGLNKSNVS